LRLRNCQGLGMRLRICQWWSVQLRICLGLGIWLRIRQFWGMRLRILPVVKCAA